MKNVTIHVKLDSASFRRFALFDTLVLRRRWVRPALFGSIMCAFAVVCFCLRKEQSPLLGGLLLTLGLGMPAVYFGVFFSQLREQIKLLGLQKPQPVYTLRFFPEGVCITNDRKAEAAQEAPWEKLYGVYRVKDSIYLYATPQKAFLLPDGQADASPDELWRLLCARIPRHLDRRA